MSHHYWQWKHLYSRRPTKDGFVPLQCTWNWNCTNARHHWQEQTIARVKIGHILFLDFIRQKCGLRTEKFCQYEVSSDHSCQVSVNPPRYWAAPTRLHLPREHLHVTGLQHSLHYAMHVSIVQCRARTLASIAGQDCGWIVQRSTRVHTTIYKGALFRVICDVQLAGV